MHFLKNKFSMFFLIFLLVSLQSAQSWFSLQSFINFFWHKTPVTIIIKSAPISCDPLLKRDYHLQLLIKELHAGIRIKNEATHAIITHTLCDATSKDSEDSIAEKLRFRLSTYEKLLNRSIIKKQLKGTNLTEEERDYLRQECHYIRTPQKVKQKQQSVPTFTLTCAHPENVII